ncbi:MalY/PatB family protein [Tuberibacillus sp. Marseille-P3662]|uniref:MalY/PatB family protein n=1 Tax=Tuberibacillus sp. Marseille-P3662 TaxID=1965358 RepID=UPI0034E8A39C
MIFDYDTEINRTNTNSVKWNYGQSIFGKEDILPLWVADMDFASPPSVIEAIQRRAKHPIFGYPGLPDAFYNAIIGWMNRRFGATVASDWITATPGVVPGISYAIDAFTGPGDKVIIQPPVYKPFFSAVENKGRRVVENPLIESDGAYYMDYADLEAKIDDRTKLLILCSPHNPIGRVWTKDEIERLAAICQKHNIIIISDEIHSDLVFDREAHTPLFTLSESIADRTVTFIAPSKTFNLAGLFSSVALIKNKQLLSDFQAASERAGVKDKLNIFGIEALIAAYNDGDEWLDQLLTYLQGNAKFVHQFLSDRIPQIKMKMPQATYLGWMDFRELGLSADELDQFLIHEAGLGLNNGIWFGPGGEGFARLNFGCPRSILERAMSQLEQAVKARFV